MPRPQTKPGSDSADKAIASLKSRLETLAEQDHVEIKSQTVRMEKSHAHAEQPAAAGHDQKVDVRIEIVNDSSKSGANGNKQLKSAHKYVPLGVLEEADHAKKFLHRCRHVCV
jgi:hypothetical protein